MTHIWHNNNISLIHPLTISHTHIHPSPFTLLAVHKTENTTSILHGRPTTITHTHFRSFPLLEKTPWMENKLQTNKSSISKRKRHTPPNRIHLAFPFLTSHRPTKWFPLLSPPVARLTPAHHTQWRRPTTVCCSSSPRCLSTKSLRQAIIVDTGKNAYKWGEIYYQRILRLPTVRYIPYIRRNQNWLIDSRFKWL